jgi:hypothetical protein
MKRFVPIASIAVLLAGIAAAAAFGFSSQFNYTGHVRGNDMASVGFLVKHTAGGTRKVTGFTATNTPYTCTNAPSGITTAWRFTPNMRVRSDRTFEGRGDWVELPLDPVGTVSGKLRRGGVAVGDFKLRGELAGPGTDCRTGLLEWRATKQQPPT